MSSRSRAHPLREDSRFSTLHGDRACGAACGWHGRGRGRRRDAGPCSLYEGYSAQDVAFPIRVFSRMGVKAVILTNAAGGIKKDFTQGRLVVISDHINLQGANPLTGPNDELFGPRFPDMSTAYDKKFRELLHAEGRLLGIHLGEGVYAALAGRVMKLRRRFATCVPLARILWGCPRCRK